MQIDPSSGVRALDPQTLAAFTRQDAVSACPQLPSVGWAARRPRVLVIEDNLDSAEMLVCLLSTMGFEARAVHDGAAAMAAALDYRPTAILSDIDLPRRNGYELAAAFRSDPAFTHVPLVALTGRAGRDEWIAGLEAGFTRFLLKPIDPGTLLQTLCELLDRRRQQQPIDGPDRRLH